MIFTRRNERELSEIEQFTHELGEGVQEVLEQLGQIKELQQRHQLAAARDQSLDSSGTVGHVPYRVFREHLPPTPSI
jgi:hypothetical protein